MPNFNGNNIGFTKFCQENVKKKLQKYLCPSAKGHGTKIFLQLFFHVFLAEFGKAYIISIEIRHGTCSFFP
jgi:hypothetical protein